MIKLKNLSLLSGEIIAESVDFDADQFKIYITGGTFKFTNEEISLYASDKEGNSYTFFRCGNSYDSGVVIYIYGNYYIGKNISSENFDTQKMKVTLNYSNATMQSSISNHQMKNVDGFDVHVIKNDENFAVEVKSIQSKDKTAFTNVFFMCFEMFLLMNGAFPEILKIEWKYGDDYVQEFAQFSEKYMDENKSRLSNVCPLFKVQNLTEKNIIDWMKIRKNKALDVFMVTCSCKMFIELRLSLLLQCSQGIGESIFNYKGEYWEVSNDLFLESPCVRQLFSRGELAEISVDHGKKKGKEAVILNQAKKHRNYFSHLAEDQSELTATQCVYFFAKFSLGLRIRLCEKIGINVDTQSVQDIVKMIDGWYQSHNC